MNQLVELKSINKKYEKKNVLYDISLSLKEKQVIAILGGNGSGKSTFLRIAAGIERPDSGQVLYASKSIRIGYVPERFPKYLRFTPDEYLHYIGRINGISKAVLNERISSLLYRFGLKAWRNQRISELSKGNIQKVGVLQAILQQPELFILDEPLSGLDAAAQQELLSIISELKEQGTTILLTYHEASIFEGMADQTYYLKDGCLTEEVMTEKEDVKLIEITSFIGIDVAEWKEILYSEIREDRLLLYVSSKNSNQILMRILELQGSIESVSSTDFNS
ncbi:ABC transporter ATP-binding protein [Oceanobacillus sp. CFH 90083]|uniref:ABC transporter ATP-binding protein n=1 Tax=Oceanobacillus sp. CFH 90083 TaxID=2592336 RepID=UPI00188452A7|nr:ABC transporter ATP-binding protein [Oceanobacillus sp. CFH 90083]